MPNKFFYDLITTLYLEILKKKKTRSISDGTDVINKTCYYAE